MSKFARYLLVFCGYLVFSGYFNPAQAKPSANGLQPNQQVLFAHFEQVIQQIDQRLLQQQAQFKVDPVKLESFVNHQILPQWDSQRTLMYLIGKKLWQQLTPEDIAALELRFQQTIQRYVREGMGIYDGQRVKTLRVQLNAKGSRGLLTLRLEPIYLPAFNIQFKIAPLVGSKATQAEQPGDGQGARWKLYDILIEGISYIKLKKNEYRQIIQNQGLNALLKMLDDKNHSNIPAPQQASLDHKANKKPSSKPLQPLSH